MAKTRHIPKRKRKRPKPVELITRLRSDDRWLEFTYQPRGHFLEKPLLIWFSIWTVGSVFFTVVFIKERCFGGMVTAGVILWVIWFITFWVVLKKRYLREDFSLDRGGVHFQRRVIVPIKTRHIPLEEIEEFATYSRVAAQTEYGDDIKASGIEIKTLGKRVRMSEELPAWEHEKLIWKLNSVLRNLRRPNNETAASVAEHDPTARKGIKRKGGGSIRSLELAKQPRKPQSGCRWKYRKDSESIRLTRRRRFEPKTVFAMLVVNFILNVFVFSMLVHSIMTSGKEGGVVMDVFSFALLIPFQAVGVLAFMGLISAVTAPLQVAGWRIKRNAIQRSYGILGIGPRKTFAIDSLARVQIKADNEYKWIFKMLYARSLWPDPEPTTAVILIDKNKREVCRIGRLTKGEALWIGDIILRERAEWFG